MPRISNYVRDANVTIKDKLLGSSYEGEGLSGPIFETRNFRIEDLIGFFSNNVLIDNVNFNLQEITDFQTNLADSLGDVNQDGSLANISINFANDLVAIVSTVPDIFTELALSNLSAIPKAFADFLFTIADANEAFANQVLDLATSVAYATADQFDSLSAFTTQLSTNVQGLEADFTNLSATVNANTGDITANATALTALGVRVTTSESDVVALNTNFTNLQVVVNENTGDISTNATSITTLGTVVNTANTNIATLQTDVTLLESSIDTLSGDVTANASDISLLTTNVDTIAGDVTAVQTDVTTLTTTVNNNTGDIATQATQVSLLANRVDTAEADILNTQTNVTSLTTNVDGNTGNISTNASNISILQTNVSTAQADITGIITDIQQIETSVNTVTGDVSANATAISGLGTRVTTAEGEIDNVQGNITTLQTNLNTQTGRIDTNVQNISTLSTTVGNNFTTLNANITAVNNARITGDAANAQSIQQVEAVINNATTGLAATRAIAITGSEAAAEANGFAESKYFVRAEANGVITGMEIKSSSSGGVGGTISQVIFNTSNFVIQNGSGVTKLNIDGSGNAVFSGNLSAAGGTFSGNLSAAGGTFAGNLSAAGGTFSGNLSAAGGTFAGDISAASGTFSGTLDAGLVNISGNIIRIGVASGYGTFGKLNFVHPDNVTSVGNIEAFYYTSGGAPFSGGIRMISDVGTEIRLGSQSPTNNSKYFIIDAGRSIIQGTSTGLLFFNLSGIYNFSNPAFGSGTTAVFDTSGNLKKLSSSLRYKENVIDYDKGIEDIKKLRPIYYKNKNEYNIHNAGFIAEEMHDLGFEEYVRYDLQGRPDAISYQNMVALLTKGMQEQQEQIDALKAEIELLKAQ